MNKQPPNILMGKSPDEELGDLYGHRGHKVGWDLLTGHT